MSRSRATIGGTPRSARGSLAARSCISNSLHPSTVISKGEGLPSRSLGATHIDIGQRGVSWLVMADPDGHELCVLTPR
ncbi:MAG TPA: VOC family protein [Streptosporangiaceae bacterium]